MAPMKSESNTYKPKEEQFKRDKTPMKKFNENIRIASLNSQGRKLEECSKYMDEKEIDILCVQEAKFPSNSFLKYKDYICVTSTNIKGGEKVKQPKTTKGTIAEKEPATATGIGSKGGGGGKEPGRYGE